MLNAQDLAITPGRPGIHVVQATTGQITDPPGAVSGTPAFVMNNDQMAHAVTGDGSNGTVAVDATRVAVLGLRARLPQVAERSG
jgi:hypothetical protein